MNVDMLLNEWCDMLRLHQIPLKLSLLAVSAQAGIIALNRCGSQLKRLNSNTIHSPVDPIVAAVVVCCLDHVCGLDRLFTSANPKAASNSTCLENMRVVQRLWSNAFENRPVVNVIKLAGVITDR